MASATNPEVKTTSIVIDSHGNVELIVTSPDKTHIAHFQVSSQILSVASPVFRAMLGANSRFKEAKEVAAGDGGAPVEIALEDDDPNALGVILWALHHRPDKVPRKLTFQQLYKVGVVIDKYDCKGAMALWLEVCWLEEWKKGDEGFKSDPEKDWPNWLFMSFVLGEREIFKAITRKLILESKLRDAVSDSTELLIDGSDDWHWGLPERVIGEIARIRRETIFECLAIAYSYMTKYDLGSFDTAKCKYKDATLVQQEACDTLIYRAILRGFKTLGLWPVIISSNYTASILNLQATLKKFSIPYFMTDIGGGCCNNPNRSHYNNECSCCGKYYSPLRKIDHNATCGFIKEFQDRIETEIKSKTGSGVDYDAVVLGGKNKGSKTKAAEAVWEVDE